MDRRGMMDDTILARLRAIAPVKTDEPLARHTTFGIGGPADVFVSVRNATELAAAVVAAREAGAAVFVLGSGSNILVGDGGIRGVVIDNQAKAHTIAPAHDDATGERFVVSTESGASFAALARSLAKQGYGGVEWAAGIPGTLGGAVVYNAGAYDGCLADVLIAATILDGDGATRRLPLPELRMAYRTSAILRGEYGAAVVLGVEFVVRQGDASELTRRVAEFDARRLGAQPRGRNSGSTFKNPAGDHAWRLIDAVGMRGMRIGDARVSEKHSNFFENLGAARAADVAALMREAQRRVREQFGIELENEVRMVGEGFA
jgi:UDP-N-acetylmuramate dehydrogenase